MWAIRARLELAGNLRDLALFNVAIDSKLRGCDLVKLAVTYLVKEDRVRDRVSVIQSKTKKPVQFELTENTRDTVIARVRSPEMIGCRFMFPSRFHDRPHISTRQYGRLVPDVLAVKSNIPRFISVSLMPFHLPFAPSLSGLLNICLLLFHSKSLAIRKPRK